MTSESNSYVLVVDDEDGIRDMLKQVLELEGYRSMEASNGQEALDLLKSHPAPALILLDVMMPVMNGRDFAVAVQNDPQLKQIPIVAITALPESMGDVAVEKVLKKPVDLDTLLSIVSGHCARA